MGLPDRRKLLDIEAQIIQELYPFLPAPQGTTAASIEESQKAIDSSPAGFFLVEWVEPHVREAIETIRTLVGSISGLAAQTARRSVPTPYIETLPLRSGAEARISLFWDATFLRLALSAPDGIGTGLMILLERADTEAVIAIIRLRPEDIELQFELERPLGSFSFESGGWNFRVLELGGLTEDADD